MLRRRALRLLGIRCDARGTIAVQGPKRHIDKGIAVNANRIRVDLHGAHALVALHWLLQHPLPVCERQVDAPKILPTALRRPLPRSNGRVVEVTTWY